MWIRLRNPRTLKKLSSLLTGGGRGEKRNLKVFEDLRAVHIIVASHEFHITDMFEYDASDSRQGVVDHLRGWAGYVGGRGSNNPSFYETNKSQNIKMSSKFGDPVTVVMNLRVPSNTRNFLVSWRNVLLKGICSIELLQCVTQLSVTNNSLFVESLLSDNQFQPQV
jgi:hypothetical protein